MKTILLCSVTGSSGSLDGNVYTTGAIINDYFHSLNAINEK